MTVGEIKKVLNQWPDNTVIFANLADAIKEPAGDYEWHNFTIDEPSQSELDHFEIGDFTYVCIDVLPEIVGC